MSWSENGFDLVIGADEAKFRRRLNGCATGVNVESVEKLNPEEGKPSLPTGSFQTYLIIKSDVKA